METHCLALRTLATTGGQHFAGLQTAARKLRLSLRMVRTLTQLETALAWMRHATQPGCDLFLEELRVELDQKIHFSKSSS
eukprot:12141493-Prorocentrum_lima.AAC.1